MLSCCHTQRKADCSIQWAVVVLVLKALSSLQHRGTFLCVCAVMFMRANIVGTVIVLSLLLWIPICIIVARVVSSSI